METPEPALYRESEHRQAQYLLTQMSFEIAELDERVGEVRARLGRYVRQQRAEQVRRAQGLLRELMLERQPFGCARSLPEIYADAATARP
jgi:hypothetical protein